MKQTEEPAAHVDSAREDPTQGPARPARSGADRVRLNSGEWLFGKIIRLRRGTLVFDSDVLDELEIDWGDVDFVATERSMLTRLEDQRTLVGGFSVDGDRVELKQADGTTRQVARAALVATVPGNTRESDHWSGGFTISGASRSGNTDQVDSSTVVHLERETAATRGAFDYVTTYSETNGTAVAYNQRANATYDVFLTPRLYVRPLGLEYYRDDFQGIQRRTTASCGLGYELVDTAAVAWNVTAGVGWQWVEFLGTQPDGTDSDNDGTAIVRTRFEWDVTHDVDFDLDYQIQAGFGGAGNVNHNLRVTLSVELFGDLDVDIGLQFDRVGDPAPLGDGSQPERDDVRVLVGFGWDF